MTPTQDDPLAIIDTPNTHGMFMLGTGTLYLCHMPMFTKEDHYYQVTLAAWLDEASMKAYLADREQHPGEAYNLINLDSDPFVLPDVANGAITSFPAAVYRGYSNEGGGTPGPQILGAATVTIDRVIRYRAFDQDIPRPAHLTYTLFGDGREAHLDHYIARDPDFQHLLTLPDVPDWLSTSQLRAGVEVAFVDLPSEPIGCESPLHEGEYRVMFQGRPGNVVPLRVGPRSTVWYSTGNMLNAQDPCGGSGTAPGMAPGMAMPAGRGA